MDIQELLRFMVAREASDLHLKAMRPPLLRLDQKLVQAGENPVSPDEIDLINGHLTATMADVPEVNNWSQALERPADRFPLINSTKSLIGHGLGAAGGL